jgi:hypothetical protein
MNSVSAESARTPAAGQLELDALELLPCGCVVAVQEARPWHVKVVSLEAKGPYCTLTWHRSDNVLRLGDPSELVEDFDEDAEEGDAGER